MCDYSKPNYDALGQYALRRSRALGCATRTAVRKFPGYP